MSKHRYLLWPGAFIGWAVGLIGLIWAGDYAAAFFFVVAAIVFTAIWHKTSHAW